MLEILTISSPTERQKIFESVDFNKTTWVVSDLKSKLILRDQLLNRYNVVSDDYVLRIHDLWRVLVQKLKPEIRWVSRECAAALVKKNLNEADLKKEGVVNLILNYIETLMPLFAHDQGHEIMQEFFQNYPLSQKKWAHWYTLAYEQWEFFLKNEIALLNWASGVLINLNDFEQAWGRTLYFDVNSNLQPLETELIKTLSRFTNVKVIVPNPQWKLDFKKSVKPYEQLFDYFKTKTNPIEEATSKYLKLTTQLGEVKAACSYVREWLDAGIDLNQIVITAPDVDVYWSALREYLKVEGIPTQKESRVSLLTFLDVHRWIASLRLRQKYLADITSGSIETALISETSFEVIQYQKFTQLYSKIYDGEDLNRDKSIKQFFTVNESEIGELTKEQFARWSTQHWESDNHERLEAILNQLYNDFTTEMKFDLADWIKITETAAAKIDTEVEPSALPGIQCVDLSLVRDLKASHVFIMGLADQNLRRTSSVLVDDSDVKALSDNFGFTLSYPESSSLEFELNWVLQNQNQNFVLTFPQTDFEGQTLAPSLTWLKGNLKQNSKEYYSDFTTRHDQLMKNVKAEDSLPVQRDLGLVPLQEIDFLPTKLSPTTIEDYSKCPFIFTAKKMFHLSDLPEVDLDIDYMTRGRLLHAIFDIILKEPFQNSMSDDAIFEVIEQARVNVDFLVADFRLWQTLKLRYFQFTKEFLQFEKEWRREFPETKTKYKEYALSGFIHTETGELTKNEGVNTIPFSGKIDRIDTENNNAIVIDYKFSTSDRNHYYKWVDKSEFQLALYAMAIEKGWIDQINFNVVGAIYYSIKEWKRDKGFLLNTGGEKLFTLNNRKKNSLTENEKQELFKSIQDKIKILLQQMKSGKYFALPQDKKTCDKCNWRQMCRAPHLL